MRRDGLPIQTMLLRLFLPAVAIVAIGLGLLAYDRLYDAILDGFDRKLITSSALTGALIDGRDHDRLIAIARTEPKSFEAEESPEYLRAVLPMRRIREKLGITYLYTQILGGSKDIIYVLDASTGDEHSNIGAEDDLPLETLAGIRRAQATGAIYLSPIEFQEQWGLLKTAAAPLRDANGRIVATAGADVNVSIIRVATQNALFASVVIGMASLLACALVILLMVRRMAQPLDRLRQEALRIAGGDHRPIPDFPAPRDIGVLKDALTRSTSELTGKLASERETVSKRALETGLAGLCEALSNVIERCDAIEFTGAADDALDTLLRRAGVAHVARRIAADAGLADLVQRESAPMMLAAGETATVRLDDGRRITLRGGA